MYVHEAATQNALDERTFVGALTDDAGLPFLGVHVHVGARDVHVAAHDERLSRGLRVSGELIHRLQESHFRNEVFASIRHVDRRNSHLRQLRGDDAMLEVERWMLERGRVGKRRGPDVQRDARVPLPAVPVARISFEVADPDRKLVERRLDLLQAEDIRLFALQKLLKLGLPRADPVYVPGGDFHPVGGWWLVVSGRRVAVRGYRASVYHQRQSTHHQPA